MNFFHTTRIICVQLVKYLHPPVFLSISYNLPQMGKNIKSNSLGTPHRPPSKSIHTQPQNINQQAVSQNVRYASERVGHLKNYVRWPNVYFTTKINYFKIVLVGKFECLFLSTHPSYISDKVIKKTTLLYA